MRDWLNRMLTPLARLLGGVHPNTVTVIGAVLGGLAGVAFWLTTRDERFFFVAAGLVATSGLADGLDGVIARVHGRTSSIGDFLDHFLDRVVELAILIGLALARGASTELCLAIALLVQLGGYLGTQIEASFGHRSYTGPGKGQLFAGLVLASIALGFAPDASARLLGRQVALVDLVFALIGLLTLQAIVHRLRLAMRLAAHRDHPPPG